MAKRHYRYSIPFKANQGRGQRVSASMLNEVQRLFRNMVGINIRIGRTPSGGLQLEGFAGSDFPWGDIAFGHTVEPEGVKIKNISVIFHGAYHATTDESPVLPISGTEGSPTWIVLRVPKDGSEMVWTDHIVARASAPDALSATFYEFPLYTFYLNDTLTITRDKIWHSMSAIHITPALS